MKAVKQSVNSSHIDLSTHSENARIWANGGALPFTICLCYILLGTTLAYSQQDDKQIGLLSKQVFAGGDSASAAKDELPPSNNSGFIVLQSEGGIVFKSHLRDFPQINIRLMNRDGKVLCEFVNPLQRNVDYLIGLSEISEGDYILHLEYGDRLVVCNIQVTSPKG